MKSRASSGFWKCYHQLPRQVQRLADKNYRLWLANPNHPSLGFKKLRGSEHRFSARVGDHYRALGEMIEDGVMWVWIGSHATTTRLLELKLDSMTENGKHSGSMFRTRCAGCGEIVRKNKYRMTKET